jgi:hypothetical protein
MVSGSALFEELSCSGEATSDLVSFANEGGTGSCANSETHRAQHMHTSARCNFVCRTILIQNFLTLLRLAGEELFAKRKCTGTRKGKPLFRRYYTQSRADLPVFSSAILEKLIQDQITNVRSCPELIAESTRPCASREHQRLRTKYLSDRLAMSCCLLNSAD